MSNLLRNIWLFSGLAYILKKLPICFMTICDSECFWAQSRFESHHAQSIFIYSISKVSNCYRRFSCTSFSISLTRFSSVDVPGHRRCYSSLTLSKPFFSIVYHTNVLLFEEVSKPKAFVTHLQCFSSWNSTPEIKLYANFCIINLNDF